ncbi:hypothetical protein [Clostridium sp.]|uniref:hypothetical protein n=1 Tax=Clostridium sp. TaxID=1506 RepID=UPI003D6D72A5
MKDRWNYFIIVLGLIFIASLFYRFIKIRKILKNEDNIVKIKRFAPIGFFFGVIGLIQLGFWMFEGEFQINSSNSSGLPFIALALNCFDYNFITEEGVVILGTKYKWSNIEKWHWKKDHYNVVILEVVTSYRFSKKSQPRLKKVELNVSQKQRNDIEKLLIKYIGENVEYIS